MEQKQMNSPNPKKTLMEIYADANDGDPPLKGNKNKEILEWIDIIVRHSEKNKAVLAALITLLLKKALSPEQDIRLHQAGMPGGFSGRVFDKNHVTPFLQEHQFPYMISGTGWLTRSLEQNSPMNKDYPGKITPQFVKDAFLNSIDAIQEKEQDARETLVSIFAALIKHRTQHKSIELICPTGMQTNKLIDILEKHFDSGGDGRLPVLAIYAVYMQMNPQFTKYKGCTLCELQPHQAADSKTGFIGDIQINNNKEEPMEAVEIKHGIELTSEILKGCFEKFKKSQVKTYYLLSTNEVVKSPEKINEYIKRIQTQHGCEIIVEGVFSILKSRLRMIDNIDQFIKDYVDLLTKEGTTEMKQEWNRLWGME